MGECCQHGCTSLVVLPKKWNSSSTLLPSLGLVLFYTLGNPLPCRWCMMTPLKGCSSLFFSFFFRHSTGLPCADSFRCGREASKRYPSDVSRFLTLNVSDGSRMFSRLALREGFKHMIKTGFVADTPIPTAAVSKVAQESIRRGTADLRAAQARLVPKQPSGIAASRTRRKLKRGGSPPKASSR